MAILVGIVTRNRAKILPRAIESVFAQSTPNVRVAVVDDASGDDTQALASDWPQVEWKFRNAQSGYMSARNDFMMRKDVDFFVSLDDDSWFVRGDEIDHALKQFADAPSLAAVAFDILSPDNPTTKKRGSPQTAGMFVGCGHMLRLSAIRHVGGYDPVPGGYGGEEKDLCIRLMDAGYRIVFLPGVHVWHEKTPVARDISWQHKSGVCNDLVMVIRRAPWFLLPVLVPGKAVRHLVFSWRANLLRPCLSGLTLFAKTLPSVWRIRRPVRFETLRAYLSLNR